MRNWSKEETEQLIKLVEAASSSKEIFAICRKNKFVFNNRTVNSLYSKAINLIYNNKPEVKQPNTIKPDIEKPEICKKRIQSIADIYAKVTDGMKIESYEGKETFEVIEYKNLTITYKNMKIFSPIATITKKMNTNENDGK